MSLNPHAVGINLTALLLATVILGVFANIRAWRPASVMPGMVRVASATTIIGPAAATVKDFWIDKFEVTNQQFKAFVDKGGYRSREYWKEPFVDGGRRVSWENAMAAFRDTRGRPGPSTWELGTYPEGQADMPVAGVSWYEAAAYAAFVGKRLPTAFHWRAAAGFNSPVENFATCSRAPTSIRSAWASLASASAPSRVFPLRQSKRA
jgi:hypothetical protein